VQKEIDMNDEIRRRSFLRLGAAAGVAAGLGSLTVAQESPKPIRLGVIGVGSRGTYHVQLALAAGIEIPALCDIKEAHLNRAIDIVEKARPGSKVEGYSKGPTDYRRMLQRDDLDAVLVTTPMQDHGVMSIDALRAGKNVLSEVAAAMTLDECWGLVKAAEETGKTYMLAENCCYWQHTMMILNMVEKGVFGDLTFAECGYVHDCRFINFEPDGTLTWRGEMARDWAGNVYPTHSLGPVAKWLGINRGDRMVSLVASSTKSAGLHDFAMHNFPEGSPARQQKFKLGDSVNVLIRTAKGRMIDLRADMYSPRPVPRTTYHALQGLKASYESRLDSIWIDGRTKGRVWEPLATYADEFNHPLWVEEGEKAEGTGHGGADYFCTQAFWNCLRTGGEPPVDVYDAAAWSAIIPLSHKSILEGGAPQEIPDFTGGKWETRGA
jgi:predicted dehydrogenase